MSGPVPVVVTVVRPSRITSRIGHCPMPYAVFPVGFTPGVAPLVAKVALALPAALALPLAQGVLFPRDPAAIGDILPLPCARRAFSAAKLPSLLEETFPPEIIAAPCR